MGMAQRGARLSLTDVRELDQASQQLVVVADTIRQMGPKWGEAAVNLLIAANLVIVRIHNKGAAAFARYLEKNGPHKPQGAVEGTPATETSDQEPIARPEPEES